MTAARKPARRATTAPPRPRSVEAAADEPDAEGDRVELFNIDGRSYTIPERPSANVLVRYLWFAKSNQDHAIMQALEDLAGPEAVAALLTYEALSWEEFGAILRGIEKTLTDTSRAAMREALGN